MIHLRHRLVLKKLASRDTKAGRLGEVLELSSASIPAPKSMAYASPIPPTPLWRYLDGVKLHSVTSLDAMRVPAAILGT